MKLIFLGTGTSQGVPMIAHPEGGCDLSDSRNWRTRTSVHVVMGGHHIQVDAAPEFRLQCVQNKIGRVDTFILTHSHADHILGMDDLRRFCDLRGGEALPVYSSEDGLQRVREIFPYAIMDRPLVRGYPAFQPHLMPDVLTVPGGEIWSTPLPHGNLPVLGLVFHEAATGKTLAYFTDCKCVPPAARKLAEGADVLVLDGLRPEVHASHMTVDEAVEIALEMNAPRAFLTHMTFAVDHAKTEERFPDHIRLAYDGLSIEV